MTLSNEYRVVVAALLIAASVGGCASTPQSRRVAGNSAALLNDYRVEVEKFAKRQTAINADVDQRVRSMNASAARLRSDNELRVTALKAADDKNATALVDQFARTDFDVVVARSRVLNDMKPATSTKPVAFDSAKVQGVVKQLNTVKQKPDLLASFRGVQDYWESLNDTYKKSLSDTKKGTDTVTADGKTQTTELIDLANDPQGVSSHAPTP
jgi:hypothetical protein